MSEEYNLSKVRTLLTDGFSRDDLLEHCFDDPIFRPIYGELEQSNHVEIVQKLIVYAYRKVQISALLDLVKRHNPARYEHHQPYILDEPRSLEDIQILLVDDSPDWQKMLGGLLKDQGYSVTTLASKKAAIEHFTNTPSEYHLAIIDMRLDETDEENRAGITLGVWLRDNDYEFPIIIMTSYSMEVEITKYISLRPFQFSAVEKGNIGTGDLGDLFRQMELALQL